MARHPVPGDNRTVTAVTGINRILTEQGLAQEVIGIQYQAGFLYFAIFRILEICRTQVPDRPMDFCSDCARVSASPRLVKLP